jgi:hypothetical protein
LGPGPVKSSSCTRGSAAASASMNSSGSNVTPLPVRHQLHDGGEAGGAIGSEPARIDIGAHLQRLVMRAMAVFRQQILALQQFRRAAWPSHASGPSAGAASRKASSNKDRLAQSG